MVTPVLVVSDVTVTGTEDEVVMTSPLEVVVTGASLEVVEVVVITCEVVIT